MEFNVIELTTYFILYSILGWIMETTFRSICEKKIINTGFLKGPYCPIYGLGAIIMLLFFSKFENNPIFLFFIAIIALTAWEYIVGVLLEVMFHTKYWDYSNHKINYKGRICLTNSIFWGFLGVIFIKYLHPFIEKLIKKIDFNILIYIVGGIFILFLIDTVTTIVNIKNMKATLEKIENINKEIKEKIKEIKNIAKQKDEKVTAENIQEMIETLKRKRNKTILRLYKTVHRLKKAFPTINTNEITQILNQKLELRKEKIKNKK